MKAGQQMTCENGHVIATAKADIDSRMPDGSGRKVSPADFDWAIPAPNTGDPIAPCPLCGAAYIKHVGLNYRPHTSEGWVE